MKKRKVDVGECSHALKNRSSEGVGDDPILESKHKIFLSHSGVQKEFVEHLCQALEDRCHYPFFDRRCESLPKGKEFPGLIIKAAQQCQLLVVVVSDEYFMSKWPMIELNAFVQASKVQKSNMNVAILPLFYGLSVSDLKDEKHRQRWLEKWETFVKDDLVEGRIKVEDWRFAVDELTKFNGLSFDRDLKGTVAYENEIVSHICKLVLPDIKWHDSHVQGNVHEVVLDKMKQIGLLQKFKVKVLGIYGVGGIGKTTICKTLCNELSSEYEGRVCHVEFDNTCSNSKEFLQNAVINLARKSRDWVCQLDEGKCQDILHKNLPNQRTFLAIDNVWDHNNSIKQAKMFLETPFHEDSLVVVTTRSQSTLALLGIDRDACIEMPELGQADATSLFLYHADREKHFVTREDMDSIERCVEKCYFWKGDGGAYHYHPLALEALGRQLFESQEKPSKWEHLLSGVWKTRSFSGENGVFDVLRSSFDLLHSNEQALFMDVGFFLCNREGDSILDTRFISCKEKLCVLYKKDEVKLQCELDSLKRKGLLQDADLTSGRFTMHDLYHEFMTLEVVGKCGEATSISDRKWVLLDGDLSELEVTPAGRCWQELSRLSIQQKEQDLFEISFENSYDYSFAFSLIDSLEVSFKNSFKDSFKDSFENSSRDLLKDPFKDSFKDLFKDSFQVLFKDSFKDWFKNSFQKSIKIWFQDLFEDLLEDLSEDSIEDLFKDSIKDSCKNTIGNLFEDLFEDSFKDSFKKSFEHASEYASKYSFEDSFEYSSEYSFEDLFQDSFPDWFKHSFRDWFEYSFPYCFQVLFLDFFEDSLKDSFKDSFEDSFKDSFKDLFINLGCDYCPRTRPIKTLEGIEWQNFSNVQVLQLWSLRFVKGSLNLKDMTCLRSLQLFNFKCLERLEGLESLKHLTCFEWKTPICYGYNITMTHFVDPFPASLKYLNISGQFVLSGLNMLSRCNNLIKMKLQFIQVGVLLDLRNCSSLKGVEIGSIEGLEILLGPTTTRSSRLRTIKMEGISEIRNPGLDQLDGLVRLELLSCGNSWEVAGLLSLTNLQALIISTHAKPAEHCIPHQLQELYYKGWRHREAPCLNAFKQLQVLEFSDCSMIQMDGMGDLPALRSLRFFKCKRLKRLPNLTKSRSLQKLNLFNCGGLELYEGDLTMLAALPLLQPIQIADNLKIHITRLDIKRRKVLRHQSHDPYPKIGLAWKEGEWKELELGLPPIKIKEYAIKDTYEFV